MERVVFPSRRGNRLVGLLNEPVEAAAGDLGAILCHGMESTKDGRKQTILSERLSKAGVRVLRFDFSYVGESEGSFEDLTFRGEVDDLAGAWEFFRMRCSGPVGILGSSMGGTVALLYAAGQYDVRALALIAAVAEPRRMLEELRPAEIERWKADGSVSLAGVRLKRSFLDDVLTLDVPGACTKIVCPTFIAHGDADRVVPVEDARTIERSLAGEKVCKVYPGADHRFSDEAHLTELLDDCSAWLLHHLESAAPL